MMKKLLEFTKSLLILGLIVSAVYLTYVAWSLSIGTSGDLNTLLSGQEESPLPPAYTEYEEVSSALTLLTPLEAVVRSDAGLCSVSGSDQTGLLFDRVRDTLGEALTTLKDRTPMSDDDWIEALSGKMVCFDFKNETPLDLISVLSGGIEGQYPDIVRLLLTSDADGSVLLCYETPDGAKIKCVTDADGAFLNTVFADYPADGSQFLYEAGLKTASTVTTLRRGSALVTERRLPSAASVSTVVLEALGFNSYTTKAYPETDTVRVYVEELNTMRLSTDGTVRYYAPGADTGIYTAPLGLKRAALLADAYDICKKATSTTLGDVSLYLIKAYTDETTGRFVVLLGVHAAGVPVVTETGYTASFSYSGTELVSAELHLRQYEYTAGDALLLPALQAAAAMDPGTTLSLRYAGENGAYALGWYAVG